MFIRSFKIHLKKSGGRIPRIELEEIGPSLDLTLRLGDIFTLRFDLGKIISGGWAGKYILVIFSNQHS